MSYGNRIKIAVFFSVLLHAAGLAVVQRMYVAPALVPPPERAPLVLDLQPEARPEPAPSPQLIDVATPAPAPVQNADHIAETHSEAMDLVENEAEHPGPQLRQDEFDALPQAAAAPAPPPPPPPLKKVEKSFPTAEDGKLPIEAMEDALAEVVDPVQSAERVPEAPIRVAKAEAAPADRFSPGMSRERSGTARHGVTNFDAIQSEIAPYLKHVRTLVERRWNEALYTRYSGTTPATAVIDCEISPSGDLVSARVVGTDSERLYSALCRDAVERAGPFGPFPFEVPAMYRGKNLEIRWTFNYLKR